VRMDPPSVGVRDCAARYGRARLVEGIFAVGYASRP
jgi:hypothetical protein